MPLTDMVVSRITVKLNRLVENVITLQERSKTVSIPDRTFYAIAETWHGGESVKSDLLLMWKSIPSWTYLISYGGHPMLADGVPIRGGEPDMALELYDGRLYGGELGG